MVVMIGIVSPVTLVRAITLAQSNGDTQPQVNTTQTHLVVKVAPGEKLPVEVKLANFGGGQRVDVLVQYEIISSQGQTITAINETVAVETTASFVKSIHIPEATKPGTYTAQTSISYPGQLDPATTKFLFTVERKVFGLFLADFYLYGGSTFIISLLMVMLGHALIKRRHPIRVTPFDYSKIPHSQRTFYEILSDTIMDMRERVGDDALLIASKIDGLTIDVDTGRVLSFSEHPSKIIASLVSEYEKTLGKKVSFTFRNKQKNV